MPAFEYIALDVKGKEEKGILEAENANKNKKQRAGKVKAADLALLTRQLATLVQSGSPLEEALSTTAKQTEKRNVKHILSAVRSKVVEGHTLADGFKTFPSVFPDMYRATVAAGEQSGHLDAVLERMADYTETRQETQQRIANAMFYPVILTILSILIVVGLLVFIVPKIINVFDNVGQELPAMTQVLISISDFFRAYGLYIGIGLVIAYIIFKQMIKISRWKSVYHNFLLKLPVIGRMTRGLNTARFARTLSILASSGVPILDAMSISAQVVQNLPMRKAVEDAAVKVREGMTINRALEQAIQQERETDGMMTKLLGIFEPVLILVMGSVVLLIVLSILLPILNLNQLVG